MKYKGMLPSLILMMAMSFSLMSCLGPNTDKNPPDETTVSVTQVTTPAVSVTSETTVTTVPVTEATEKVATDVSETSVILSGNADYEYDALGRLIRVKYDESNYIEYEYDANGNITKVRKTINGEAEKAS